MSAIKFVQTDGGRKASGWKGEKVGDCVVRAFTYEGPNWKRALKGVVDKCESPI